MLTSDLCVWFLIYEVHLNLHKFSKILTKYLPLCNVRLSSFLNLFQLTDRHYLRIPSQCISFTIQKKLLCKKLHWNEKWMREFWLNWVNFVFLWRKDVSFWFFSKRTTRHRLFSLLWRQKSRLLLPIFLGIRMIKL